MEHFHTIILGGGPGGIQAAKTLARAGKQVALVSDNLGGECLNFGCIPTKTYLWTAELLERLSQAETFGLRGGPLIVDWEIMKARRREVVAKLKKNLLWSLERAGVKIIEGRGKLKDEKTMEIDSPGDAHLELTAEFIILATGSSALFPAGFEKNDRFLSNREMLDLAQIPKTLLVIGGGAIGVEFASLFAALGAKVTIAEAAARLLPNEDGEVSAELERIFAKKGIEILKNTKITPEQTGDYEITLVAVGRKPNFEDLGLPPAQLKAPHISIIGDLAGKTMLAYTAEREGEIAARKILGGNPELLNYEAVPNTIFCLPEVASVGLTEEKIKERGIPYVSGKAAMSANAKALIMGSREGFAKILAEKSTKLILGVHMIGEKSSELIAEASLAISQKLTLSAYSQNLRSHPVLGEALKEAALDALQKK